MNIETGDIIEIDQTGSLYLVEIVSQCKAVLTKLAASSERIKITLFNSVKNKTTNMYLSQPSKVNAEMPQVNTTPVLTRYSGELDNAIKYNYDLICRFQKALDKIDLLPSKPAALEKQENKPDVISYVNFLYNKIHLLDDNNERLCALVEHIESLI